MPPPFVAATGSTVTVTPGIAAATDSCNTPLAAASESAADTDPSCAVERPATVTTTEVAAPLGNTSVIKHMAARTLKADAKAFWIPMTWNCGSV